MAKEIQEWLARACVRTLYIQKASPWENGYVESFNGKLRDELLAREVFDTLLEAKVLIERWRKVYNAVRPHSSLGYRPSAPESRRPWQGYPGDRNQLCPWGQVTSAYGRGMISAAVPSRTMRPADSSATHVAARLAKP